MRSKMLVGIIGERETLAMVVQNNRTEQRFKGLLECAEVGEPARAMSPAPATLEGARGTVDYVHRVQFRRRLLEQSPLVVHLERQRLVARGSDFSEPIPSGCRA